MTFTVQSSDAQENCGFVRWVDPPPIDPHQEYIEYLQTRIFDLETKLSHEMEVSQGNKDDEDDDNSKGGTSQEEQCTIPYCKCPCHNNKGPTAPPPQPPPPAMGGYYGEGATQFAMWGHY